MKTLLTVPLLAASLMTGRPASAQDASRGGNLEKPFRMPVRTELWAQTTPAFGGGDAAGRATADGEEKTFRIITVKHVYVGGIAAMFKESGVVPTAPFVSPGFANGGMGGRGGMMGGGMMGGGMMGGGMMGGGMMGGGMMGGGMMGGGFGGGGFGGGGFGGGGFGGGGFGGGGFGRRGRRF